MVNAFFSLSDSLGVLLLLLQQSLGDQKPQSLRIPWVFLN